jgi:iron complex transport system substrate-binding protein
VPRLLFLIAVLLCCGFAQDSAAQKQEYPQRIISLGPLNTENVFLLGAGERLVANTSYCTRPEAAKTKEKIGSVMQFSVEKIISLRPDLVLATGLTPEAQLEKLRSLGLRVVRMTQPASFQEICKQFLELGRLLGLEQRAIQVVEQARHSVAAVQQRTAGLERPGVFLQVGARPLFGSVRSSFTHDFIRLAGGRNILADQQVGTTSYEKVLARDPDVILIAIMGTESGTGAGERKKWLSFAPLSAVKNNRVHVIDPDLVCSPSPLTFARTLEVIAGLLHPELHTGKK